MKPVLIQTLFKKMKGRIRLPDPPSSAPVEPERRDRTGQIMITVFIIAIVICFML